MWRFGQPALWFPRVTESHSRFAEKITSTRAAEENCPISRMSFEAAARSCTMTPPTVPQTFLPARQHYNAKKIGNRICCCRSFQKNKVVSKIGKLFPAAPRRAEAAAPILECL